jgi:hypothetical protein
LTPFFSDDGATPWGEVVPEVKEAVASPERHLMWRDRYKVSNNDVDGKSSRKQEGKPTQTRTIMATADNDSDWVFLTDQEITARNQEIGLAERKASKQCSTALEQQYHQDMEYIQNWVDSLPQPPPTRHFGEFKFNVDTLMDALYQHY